MKAWNDSDKEEEPEEEPLNLDQEFKNDLLFIDQMDNKGRQFSLEVFFSRTKCSANLEKILKC